MSSRRSSVSSRRVVKMSSRVVTSVVRRSSCAVTWVVKRTSRVVTSVVTLSLGSSEGSLWCRHNGRQIVRKWKSRQLSSIVVSCHLFVSPKSSTWQSCLSCCIALISFFLLGDNNGTLCSHCHKKANNRYIKKNGGYIVHLFICLIWATTEDWGL